MALSKLSSALDCPSKTLERINHSELCKNHALCSRVKLSRRNEEFGSPAGIRSSATMEQNPDTFLPISHFKMNIWQTWLCFYISPYHNDEIRSYIIIPFYSIPHQTLFTIYVILNFKINFLFDFTIAPYRLHMLASYHIWSSSPLFFYMKGSQALKFMYMNFNFQENNCVLWCVWDYSCFDYTYACSFVRFSVFLMRYKHWLWTRTFGNLCIMKRLSLLRTILCIIIWMSVDGWSRKTKNSHAWCTINRRMKRFSVLIKIRLIRSESSNYRTSKVISVQVLSQLMKLSRFTGTNSSSQKLNEPFRTRGKYQMKDY